MRAVVRNLPRPVTHWNETRQSQRSTNPRTRYGNFPAQWKTFWDKTGKQWAAGGFWGKMAGLFISTGTLGGGQESTAIAAMSTLAHHGIIYVPFGYAKAFAQMSDLSEVHGE